MDHVAGPLHILLAKKEGRISFNIICLKLYQFKRITWWYLSFLESNMRSTLQFVLKFVMLEKILEKNHSLPENASRPPLGGGHDENFGRP